ncbi:MAG TPA: anti-sigma factor [Gemmatimonadales bacterium]|nr:anti-sigma factor [Gemmatimonadales bacterium]
MTSHDWFDEHRMEYAMHLLDARDTATFEDHLASCAACRDEVAAIERDLAWLPMGAEPAAPRPDFRRRAVDEVLRHERARRGPRWMPMAAAASLLLALGSWWAGTRRADAELATARARLEALEDTLSVIRGAGRVLQASVEMNGAQGGLLIFADERTHRWNVVVHGLPPAPPTGRYQFWFICAEGMVRGAEVRMPGEKPANFTTDMPTVPCTVQGAALSVEPMDATTGPPKGDMIAHLML